MSNHFLGNSTPNPVFSIVERLLLLLQRPDLRAYERERYRRELVKLIASFS